MFCSLRKEDFFPLLDTNNIIHDQGRCLTINCPYGLIGSHPAKDSVDGLSLEELIKASRKVLKEEREQEEAKTIIFSDVSQSDVSNFLQLIKLIIVLGDLDTLETEEELVFLPFEWNDHEETDTPRAKAHLKKELSKFDIHFGRSGYDIYDVHDKQTILNVRDEKIGKLSGGTDLIIAPYGISFESVKQQICIAVELKTTETINSKTIESLMSQATMELIASNYHSQQMTLVILSDLSGCVIMLTFTRENDNIAIIKYHPVTLNQMACFIRNHLDNNCVTIRTYKIPDEPTNDKESDSIMRAFKKQRVTDFTTTTAWELFQEDLEYEPLGSRERAIVVQEFFRSNGLPDSKFLSMYA